MTINRHKKGQIYELDVVKKYKQVGYKECCRSRYASKEADTLGLDLLFPEINGQSYDRPPFNIQCKNLKQMALAQALAVLKYMPRNEYVNILHLKITNEGSAVVISEDDRMQIVALLQSLNITSRHQLPLQEG